jgi:hypothetical protein
MKDNNPNQSDSPSQAVAGDREAFIRIGREEYPEIIQAARWSDEDSGTNHFEPGVGFIVDDPDGLSIPVRWLPHLSTIEAALAALDHERPHPLDADAIRVLSEGGREPTIYDSAVYCFVCGEHTPMTAMQHSSEELWIASRFLNEYFEGWTFDPASGFPAILSTLRPTNLQAENERLREALESSEPEPQVEYCTWDVAGPWWKRRARRLENAIKSHTRRLALNPEARHD